MLILFHPVHASCSDVDPSSSSSPSYSIYEGHNTMYIIGIYEGYSTVFILKYGDSTVYIFKYLWGRQYSIYLCIFEGDGVMYLF